MIQIFLIKIKSIIILIFILINYNINVTLISFKIFISSEFEKKKFWVGEEHSLIIKKYPENSDEKIYFKSLNNRIELLPNKKLFMKSSGRECLTAYTIEKNKKESLCFNIYNTPNLTFKENNTLRIETNKIYKLNLEIYDYPKSYIKFETDHEEIIKVNNEGLIFGIRPGFAIIKASGLDNINTQIKVLSVSKEGLLKNYILDLYNANKYDNLMIVAHPDDETLWGGAHLSKKGYFVVCMTNGYNIKRAIDFKKVIKFTKNSGIILNYPDLQDDIKDEWFEVEDGIIQDIRTLLNYKNWKIIVTHGPEGTTGHIHHKKLSNYITKVAKENNKFNILYYFGIFYKKKELPNNLKGISRKDFLYKRREISIYKSVKKDIHRLWYHFIQFENWVSAINWEKNNIK